MDNYGYGNDVVTVITPIDKELLTPFLSETQKVVIQPGMSDTFFHKPVSEEMYATGMRNLLAYGYAPSKDLADALHKLNADDFMQNYDWLIEFARAKKGFQMENAELFWSGFPDTVLEKSEAEMFSAQLISYVSVALTGKDMPPEDRAVDRMPLFEKFTRKPAVLNLGTMEDVKKFYESRIWSNNSLSAGKLEETVGYMASCSSWKRRLTKEPIPNKENAASFALEIAEIEPDKRARLSLLGRMLPTTVDVLRYAALLSNGKYYKERKTEKYQTYIYKTHRMEWRTYKTVNDAVIENKPDLSGKVVFRLSSAEAHTVKMLLAEKPNLYEDLWSRKELFKNLAKSISMRDKTPERLKMAYDRLCQNERVNERGEKIYTAFGKVEEAIVAYRDKGDIAALKKAAGQFPGIFSRNYLRLADIAISRAETPADREWNVGELAAIYGECCRSVPIREQLKLLNVIDSQAAGEDRYIYESKLLKYVTAPVSDIRKSMTDGERFELRRGILDSIMAALEAQPDLGKVYIDPAVNTLLLPENGERASSKGSVLTSGSRIKLNKEANIVRPFIWWTNLKDGDYEERVDIDLSATFMDKDMMPIGDCSYRNQRLHDENGYGFIAISSGDRTDGGDFDGKGVGEFLDIDKAACERNDVRYVSFSVHGYTSQNFNKLAHIKFGFMQREGHISCPRDAEEHGVNPDSVMSMANEEAEMLEEQHVFDTGNGEAYEPSTVDFCCDLNYPATQETTALLDIEKGELIWVDKPMELARGLQTSLNEKFVSNVVAQTHKLLNPVTPSIGELFEMHAVTRGDLVKDIKEADLVILPKPMDEKELGVKEGARVITAYDIGTISEEFMRSFKDDKARDRSGKKLDDLDELYEKDEDIPEETGDSIEH